MSKAQEKIVNGMSVVEILSGVGNLMLSVGFLNIYLLGPLWAAWMVLTGLLGLIAGINIRSAKRIFGAAEIFHWLCRLLLLLKLFLPYLDPNDSNRQLGDLDPRLIPATIILNGGSAAIFLILYLVREYRIERGGNR